MAIAFARAEYKSRSSGGNAVRSSAYNGRDRLADERTGERFDFRGHRKAGDIALGVILPEGASAEFGEPARLWNAAEAAEKRNLITHNPQPTSAGGTAWAGCAS